MPVVYSGHSHEKPARSSLPEFAYSLTDDIISGYEIDLGTAGLRAVVGTGASVASGEITNFTGMGQQGVNTLAQIPHFSPRSVQSSLDFSKVNSRGLWADAVIGEVVGTAAERAAGLN